jgi:hypothetical protein
MYTTQWRLPCLVSDSPNDIRPILRCARAEDAASSLGSAVDICEKGSVQKGSLLQSLSAPIGEALLLYNYLYLLTYQGFNLPGCLQLAEYLEKAAR